MTGRQLISELRLERNKWLERQNVYYQRFERKTSPKQVLEGVKDVDGARCAGVALGLLIAINMLKGQTDGGKNAMKRIVEPFNAISTFPGEEIVTALEILSNQIFNLHKDMDEWESTRQNDEEKINKELSDIRNLIADISEGRSNDFK